MRPVRIIPTYSTVQVAAMTGATYRQLDYWARTGRIPGQDPGASTGSGHARAWTVQQVERARALVEASRLLRSPLEEVADFLEAM